MKQWLTCGAMAIGLGAMALGAAREPAVRAEGEPAWLPGFEQARAAARLQRKPIFLVFR